MYDYSSKGQKNAKGESDIGFKKGDTMVLLEEFRANGWVLAKMKSESGLVPCNYITKVDPPGEVKISQMNKKEEEKKKMRKATLKAQRKQEKNSVLTMSFDDLKRSQTDITGNLDFRIKYEEERQQRQKLEEEIRVLKLKLNDYESQYGPLNYSLPMIHIENLPPPPEDLNEDED